MREGDEGDARLRDRELLLGLLRPLLEAVQEELELVELQLPVVIHVQVVKKVVHLHASAPHGTCGQL